MSESNNEMKNEMKQVNPRGRHDYEMCSIIEAILCASDPELIQSEIVRSGFSNSKAVSLKTLLDALKRSMVLPPLEYQQLSSSFNARIVVLKQMLESLKVSDFSKFSYAETTNYIFLKSPDTREMKKHLEKMATWDRQERAWCFHKSLFDDVLCKPRNGIDEEVELTQQFERMC